MAFRQAGKNRGYGHPLGITKGKGHKWVTGEWLRYVWKILVQGLNFTGDTRYLTVGQCFVRHHGSFLSQGRTIPAGCYLGQVEAIAAHHCCAEDHGQGVCYILAGNVRC